MMVERSFFRFWGCDSTFFHAEMVYFSGVQKELGLAFYFLKFLAIKRFVTSAEYMIDRKMIFSYDWDMKIPAALTRKTETLNEKCKCGFQRDELL